MKEMKLKNKSAAKHQIMERKPLMTPTLEILIMMMMTCQKPKPKLRLILKNQSYKKETKAKEKIIVKKQNSVE